MSEKDLRILVLGDSPNSHGGYAIQTRQLAHRLGNVFDVHYLGFQTSGEPYEMIFEGQKLNFKVWGNTTSDSFAHDAFLKRLQQIKPHIVFHNADLWMVLKNISEPLPQQRQFSFSVWFPVDAPPLVTHQLDALRLIDIPVVLTQFGKKICADHGFTNIEQIPHGIDFSIYKPLLYEYQDAIKRQLGLYNKKIILFVFRNQPRKVPQIAMDAIRQSGVMKRNDTVALFWTDPNEKAIMENEQSGWDIREIRKNWKMENKIILPEDLGIPYEVMEGFTSAEMNQLFNASDFGLYLTSGEGWNLPISESLAVGKPVIASNMTSHPEVTGPGGRLVDIEWTNPAQIAGVERYYADTKKAAEHIDEFLDNPQLTYELGQKGMEYVHKNYDVDDVAKRFIELFRNKVVKMLV